MVSNLAPCATYISISIKIFSYTNSQARWLSGRVLDYGSGNPGSILASGPNILYFFSSFLFLLFKLYPIIFLTFHSIWYNSSFFPFIFFKLPIKLLTINTSRGSKYTDSENRIYEWSVVQALAQSLKIAWVICVSTFPVNMKKFNWINVFYFLIHIWE